MTNEQLVKSETNHPAIGVGVELRPYSTSHAETALLIERVKNTNTPSNSEDENMYVFDKYGNKILL